MIVFPRLRRPRPGFLTFALLVNLSVLLLAAAALGWVARHAGPTTGTVVLHVTEPDVVVSLGGQTLGVIEYTATPFVLDLHAGQHQLTMTRGVTLLHAETFTLEGGEERVLTAWSSRAHKREEAEMDPEDFACREPSNR